MSFANEKMTYNGACVYERHKEGLDGLEKGAVYDVVIRRDDDIQEYVFDVYKDGEHVREITRRERFDYFTRRDVSQIISEVESGERKLSEEMAPRYYEREYDEVPSDFYIVHNVAGTDIDVYFPEQDHITEMREKFRRGEITDDELSDYIGEMNGYDDMYDYDNVAAYEVNGEDAVFVSTEGAV